MAQVAGNSPHVARRKRRVVHRQTMTADGPFSFVVSTVAMYTIAVLKETMTNGLNFRHERDNMLFEVTGDAKG